MLRSALSCLLFLIAPAAFARDPEGAATYGVRPRREIVDSALEWISTGIEVAGVAIIVIGAVTATALFLRNGFRTSAWAHSFDGYRANLGRGILLGLELLVAADIIGTVAVTPSLENLAVLGAIVLIRTFLSFSLEVEIEGRWPWQKGRGTPAGDPPESRLSS
jgi:uncharacterized membrane protein